MRRVLAAPHLPSTTSILSCSSSHALHGCSQVNRSSSPSQRPPPGQYFQDRRSRRATRYKLLTHGLEPRLDRFNRQVATCACRHAAAARAVYGEAPCALRLEVDVARCLIAPVHRLCAASCMSFSHIAGPRPHHRDAAGWDWCLVTPRTATTTTPIAQMGHGAPQRRSHTRWAMAGGDPVPGSKAPSALSLPLPSLHPCGLEPCSVVGAQPTAITGSASVAPS
mmetsp:Transcript_3138/g.9085  ORF Transcript_3138/g.9085 Transcript_3138/m.9085 type:complete len:223 (-) Transcript_3138:299-967(-)